eukprot:1214622-Rhodomonas_salina.1
MNFNSTILLPSRCVLRLRVGGRGEWESWMEGDAQAVRGFKLLSESLLPVAGPGPARAPALAQQTWRLGSSGARWGGAMRVRVSACGAEWQQHARIPPAPLLLLLHSSPPSTLATAQPQPAAPLGHAS